jgi:hypothetical protein
MNPTKIAAILALIVALVALGYAGYQSYENSVLLRDQLLILRAKSLTARCLNTGSRLASPSLR